MAKKKDPAVAVIRYFETADLSSALLVLSLAKDTIARRKPAREQAAAGEIGSPVRRPRKSSAAAPAAPPAPLPGA